VEPLTRRVHAWDEMSDETVCGLDVSTLPTGSVTEAPDWADHFVRVTYSVWAWCPDCERVLSPDIYRCTCSPEDLADQWKRDVIRGWGALVLRDATKMVRARTPEWCAPSVRMDASAEEGIVTLTVVWAEAR
jgi:hypothetical protein